MQHLDAAGWQRFVSLSSGQSARNCLHQCQVALFATLETILGQREGAKINIQTQVHLHSSILQSSYAIYVVLYCLMLILQKQ